MTDSTIDTNRQDAFETRLLDTLNAGATSLMISIGHRTGLFDTMADGASTTIEGLADAAACDPRYVQEWLGAMTVADIVDHDGGQGTYWLPPERAALLSRRSTVNMAAFAQYIPMLGSVEDDIIACFGQGGGVPYERYPRFHEIMEEESGQSTLPALEAHILPLVEALPERLASGIRMLDVGCGRGRALLLLAAGHPASSFVGYDLSDDAVAYARHAAADAGLDNVHFEVLDAARLAEVVPEASFDFITTFDAVHDQAEPAAVLRGIRRALAPDGVYLAQDIDATSSHEGDREHALGPLLYAISCLHCMTVSLARDGEGLGAMWGRKRALQYLTDAGFTDIDVHTLEHDPQNAYYVCRP